MDSALTIKDCHVHTIARGRDGGRNGVSRTANGRNRGVGKALECCRPHRACARTECRLPGCLLFGFASAQHGVPENHSLPIAIPPLSPRPRVVTEQYHTQNAHLEYKGQRGGELYIDA